MFYESTNQRGNAMRKSSAGALTRSLLVLGASLASAVASAQAFPSRPIKMVVPFPPGGGADIIARAVLPGIQSGLGATIVVDNRPGAGGSIGANIVAKSPPDGYTLLLSDPGAAVHAIGLIKDLPYDPAKDLVAVAGLIKAAMMVAAGSSAKFSNLAEFVEYVKANPGAIAIADSGAGSAHHLSLELFKARTNLNFQIVHYKGSAASVQDMLGGQIPMVVAGPNAFITHIKSGRVKPIAITGKSRIALFPDVPSLAEVSPGYEALTWTAIWAPAGTPRDILLRLNAEVARTVRSAEVSKRFTELGLDPWPSNLEETAQFWQSELAVWPDLIRRLGLASN